MSDFNKKMAKKILNDLQLATKQMLSMTALVRHIEQNRLALDTTFPQFLSDMLDETLTTISNHQHEQYAAMLNTPDEGTYDETLPIGSLFDDAISHLNDYIHET